jgi:deoxyribonuclease (pyrimidine dimer)
MTRVNLVPPEDLADQHLFAEWRELKMIPAKVRKNLAKAVSMADIPAKYTLSTGHVKFFYNKMGWLYIRHQNLTRELKKRNFNISDFNAFEAFLHEMPDEHIGNDWFPTPDEIKVNVNRIIERLNQRPDWYRHYGEIKPPSFFSDRYTFQVLVDTLNSEC